VKKLRWFQRPTARPLETNASGDSAKHSSSEGRRSSLHLDISGLSERVLSSVAGVQDPPRAVAMCHGPRGRSFWSYGQGPGPGVKLKKPETVPLNVDDAGIVPVVLTTTTKSD